MSDSSSTQLFYRAENVWGEDPTQGSSPLTPLRELRFTNESLNFAAQTAVSEEIRSDRQVADIIRTGVETGGDVGIEFSFGAHDDLFEGALYNDWTAVVDSNTGSPEAQNFVVAGSPVGSVISFGSPSGGSVALLDSLPVGAFIEITESSLSPVNDGFTRVVANSGAGSVTVSPALQTVGNDTFRIRASHLRNGVVLKSFLLEKAFTDVNEFFTFTGMRVGTAALNIAPGEILNGSFGFQGQNSTVQGTSIVAGLLSPETVPIAANDVFNAVDNVANVLIDGVADPDVCFTEISIAIDNSLRFQPCIGQLESSGIGVGRNSITGTLAAYFVNRTFYEKYINFDTVSISFTVALGGNTYLIDFPSVKFTNGEVVAGGNDQDVLASIDFTAKRDSTLGFTMGMNRYGTIPTLVQ
ncbi:MAG: hypothetical protein E4G91_01330 [Candidatus Zixiibacteriota bacterium]|nr:MAG: hypothetical protein E4G91_01330 [candidate division Zixibacteria bacterium]